MITEEVVDQFIVNHLNVPDWKQKFEENRLQFLRKLVRNHVFNIYFQNITIAADAENRAIVTVSDVLKRALKGSGGVCFDNNYFFYLILEFLGYDAMLVGVELAHNVTPNSYTHMAIVVKMCLELYLIDVGFSFPNYEIIPLHQLPYKGKAGGLSYEYREEDGIYSLVQLQGGFFKGNFPEGQKEQLKYSFKLIPREFDSFQVQLSANFLKQPVLFRHFEGINSEARFVMVLAKGIVSGDTDTRTAVIYESYEELISAIKKYFPKIDSGEISKAIKHFNQFQVLPKFYELR